MNLDLNTLRIVLAVAECQSYTRAAQKLGITQPAVSRRILALERTLNTRLFKRDGYRFVLTEAGASVCERARQMIVLAEELPAVAQNHAAEPSGNVSLGLPSSLGEVLLPPLVSFYRKSYPKVFMRVEQGYAADLWDMLQAKLVDVAVVYAHSQIPTIESMPLINHELGLVFPRAWTRRGPKGKPIGSELAMRETEGFPLVLTSGSQSIRRLVDDAYHQVGVIPRVEMEVNSLAFLKATVRAGLGCTFLASSGFHGREDSAAFGFARITKPTIPWTMYIAVRKQGQPTLAATLLIRAIQTVAEQLIVEKKWDGEIVHGRFSE